MKDLARQPPNANSQRPRQLTWRVGGRDLAVGTPISSDRSASALRLIVTTVAVLMIGGSSSVLACPMCFGAEETSMVDGTKLGVLVMLAITLAVQGAFVGFFFYLRRRAKRIAEIELDTEWSELQGASRAS
jgi:hypothetical protein